MMDASLPPPRFPAAAPVLTALAVAGGVAAIVARVIVSPPALEAAEGLAVAAPWIAAGVAVVVGALMFRSQRARAARAGADRSDLIGPDVASLALGPVAAGVGAWFVVAAGVPLCATQMAGLRVTTQARVVERLDGASLGCLYRVVLASEALPHPMAVCVDRETWVRAEPGSTVSVETVRAAAGLEIREVGDPRAGSATAP